jgi:chromosome segregation ATPase
MMRITRKRNLLKLLLKEMAQRKVKVTSKLSQESGRLPGPKRKSLPTNYESIALRSSRGSEKRKCWLTSNFWMVSLSLISLIRTTLEHSLEQIKNAKPDLAVLKEWKRREEEFLNRAQDLDAVTAQRDAQKQRYDGLRKQRLDEFMTGFNLISLKLKEMYQVYYLGNLQETYTYLSF